MAVVAVQPIFERRRSTFRNNVLAHFLMWLVTCDNGNDGPAAAIEADGLPSAGDVFIDNRGNVAYLTALDAEPRSPSDRHFEVQAEFDTISPSTPDDNPLNQPPMYAWSYENTTEAYFTDNSTNGPQGGGVQVTTSAGEAFEQLPTRDTGVLVITMTRNEATHDAAGDDQYSNTVNAGPVVLDGTTYATGTLKMSPITAVKSVKTMRSGLPVTYYTRTFTFKAKHQGWHDRPLDVGFNYSVGQTATNTQNLRRIVDGQGMPVTKPWPLNGKGAAMPNASDPPAVLDFQPYTSMDWSALKLT